MADMKVLSRLGTEEALKLRIPYQDLDGVKPETSLIGGVRTSMVPLPDTRSVENPSIAVLKLQHATLSERMKDTLKLGSRRACLASK